MKKELTIFLDMDGVLVNWHAGAEKALNVKFTDEQLKMPRVEEALNMSKADFWRTIEEYDRFWERLEAYDWASSLWSICNKFGPTYILSSPTRHSTSCCSGKVRWLQHYFGREFQGGIFTKHKFLCANPHTLLIDDMEDVADKFEKHGGKTLLFPQPWNSAGRWELPEIFVQNLPNRLETIIDGLV